MFGLNKDTPVVGKSDTLVEHPSKDNFNYVGANGDTKMISLAGKVSSAVIIQIFFKFVVSEVAP